MCLIAWLIFCHAEHKKGIIFRRRCCYCLQCKSDDQPILFRKMKNYIFFAKKKERKNSNKTVKEWQTILNW